VSGVFRTIDPPPLSTQRVSPPPKAGGVHTRRAVKGREVNISEDARHWIGLLQHNLSTVVMFNLWLVSDLLTVVGMPAVDPVLKRAQFNQKINNLTQVRLIFSWKYTDILGY
jgi:hypothetical protein